MKTKRVLVLGLLLGILVFLVFELYIDLDKTDISQHKITAPPVKVYGQALPWDEAKKLFPRYSIAVLVDVETGKQFEVERRGGTYHADIQPVTNKDTEILKELYPYGWSWKRRAVIAYIGMEAVAASINGMPHGSGKIKGNNFRGHFCIHFKDSRVHLSRKVDLAHQMMVWKAAGQPLEPFLKAGPREVLDLVFTALNQDDPGLATLGIHSGFEEDLWLVIEGLNRRLPQIEIKRLSSKKTEEDKPNPASYQITVKLNYPEEKGIIERTGDLTLSQNPGNGRWLVEGSDLKKLLERL